MFCPQCRSEYRAGFTRCENCDTALVATLPPEAGDPSHRDLVTVFETGDPGLLAMAHSILDEARDPLPHPGGGHPGSLRPRPPRHRVQHPHRTGPHPGRTRRRARNGACAGLEELAGSPPGERTPSRRRAGPFDERRSGIGNPRSGSPPRPGIASGQRPVRAVAALEAVDEEGGEVDDAEVVGDGRVGADHADVHPICLRPRSPANRARSGRRRAPATA